MPEIQADGWDWAEDDDTGERCIPRVTLCGATTALWPRPPEDWFKVITYDTSDFVEFVQTAAWMYCLLAVQQREARHFGRMYRRGQRRRPKMHMICRDQKDERVLVVHPALLEEAENAVEGINGVFNGYGSNCGGWEILEQPLQNKAALVFTRRACADVDPIILKQIYDQHQIEVPDDFQNWRTLSISHRLEVISKYGLAPSLLYDDQIVHHWLVTLEDDSWASSLASQIYRSAREVSIKRDLHQLRDKLAGLQPMTLDIK